MHSISVKESMMYAFLVNPPVGLSIEGFGFWRGTRLVLMWLILLVVIPLMKAWTINDKLLVIFGQLSTVSSNLLLGLSSNTWMVFLCKYIFCDSLSN